MIWIFALIGIVTVTFLLVRAFGPRSRAEVPRNIAPDDDPEFLWSLDAEKRRRDADDK